MAFQPVIVLKADPMFGKQGLYNEYQPGINHCILMPDMIQWIKSTEKRQIGPL
jgi:hypothetical protein